MIEAADLRVQDARDQGLSAVRGPWRGSCVVSHAGGGPSRLPGHGGPRLLTKDESRPAERGAHLLQEIPEI